MLIDIRVNNMFVFRNKVELSLKADMRIKKFGYNVYQEDNFNILKTVGIYGQNNVGKTCLLKCIRSIKNILLNKKSKTRSNIFVESRISEIGITFIEKGEKYSYDVKFDSGSNEFIYEKFSKYFKDEHGNEKEKIKLLRDTLNKDYEFEDEEIKNIMKLTAKNNILIYLIDVAESKNFESIKNTLVSFANKIDYVDMNEIPIQKTIELLKNENNLQQKIVNFILNADLDMTDFKYSKDTILNIKTDDEIMEEKLPNLPDNLIDQMKLTSFYKGKAVPSIFFDSIGTKKIVALSSYIIEALEKGKILVIDELDSSIHFKLARAIVSMFNNELNINSQLIFSVHDINLMDCKRLFRKEQIWFIHKDEEGVFLYPLSDFTAEDGVRSDSDIIEKYKKGVFGAIPEPNMINTLLEVEHE